MSLGSLPSSNQLCYKTRLDLCCRSLTRCSRPTRPRRPDRPSTRPRRSSWGLKSRRASRTNGGTTWIKTSLRSNFSLKQFRFNLNWSYSFKIGLFRIVFRLCSTDLKNRRLQINRSDFKLVAVLQLWKFKNVAYSCTWFLCRVTSKNSR